MTPRARFDLIDVGLFGLGLGGLVLFVQLLPGQHPDSAATYALGREAAVEQAEAFLTDQGYATGGLVPVAQLRRETRLLDSLQTGRGRRQTLRLLEAGTEELPAYYWRVRWKEEDPEAPATMGTNAPEQGVFKVDLTQRGAVWRFLNPEALVPDAARAESAAPRRGSRLDLDERVPGVLPPDRASGAAASQLPTYFELLSGRVVADSLPPHRADPARPQALTATAAAEMARDYLSATALGALPLAVISVEAVPERGRSAARVRFETTERVYGQRVSAEVDVSAADALLGLGVAFNEAEQGSEGREGFPIGADAVRSAAKAIGYVVLVLLLLVVMFRRLSVRSLDARAAIKDALAAGGAVAGSSVLTTSLWAGEVGDGWSVWVFVLIGTLFSGAGLGLLVFVASSASDALARGAWPQQIETLSLARQGRFVNQPVGRALVRGVAVAGVLLGAATLALVLAPFGVLASALGLLTAEVTYSVFGVAVATGVWYALLLTLAVYVGLGSLLRRWHARAVVPGLAVAVAVLGFEALDVPTGSAWLAWGVLLVLGLMLAWAYARYDALTVLAAVFVTGVLWDTAEGWLVAASPAFVDAVLGFVLAGGVAALGVAGVRSARAGETLPRYEPDYVAEQRERGRLARELEIAREVQRSFLPARMPEAAGVDLAARCLAAEEVGGDYYDVIPLGDGRLALVIGDVSGKGIQAAFFMTLAKGFLQTLARETDRPAEVLRRANRLFVANASRGTFISLIYGVFDLEAQTFTFARAGHNPVILKRAPSQSADFLQPPGLAIGLTDRAVFDETIREQTIALRRGDTLVFYTDGFSEAMDAAKTLYTDERLADAVADAGTDTSAEDLLQALVTDVLRHAGSAPQHDDMTMIVARIGVLAEGEAAPPVAVRSTSEV